MKSYFNLGSLKLEQTIHLYHEYAFAWCLWIMHLLVQSFEAVISLPKSLSVKHENSNRAISIYHSFVHRFFKDLLAIRTHRNLITKTSFRRTLIHLKYYLRRKSSTWLNVVVLQGMSEEHTCNTQTQPRSNKPNWWRVWQIDWICWLINWPSHNGLQTTDIFCKVS